MATTPIVFPDYLKKNDFIGVVCPAGYMPAEKLEDCFRTIESDWGFHIKKGKTIGSRFHYFSGTDEERLCDLQLMLDDPEIKAILFGRGGYGISRIIDDLDFRAFRKNPKWLIGFSDVTLLHAHIHRRYGIASLHAPMANAFHDGGYKNEYIRSLQKAILGKKADYVHKPDAMNRPGKFTGQVVGGNLTMLAHICGTASALRAKNKILFIEDTGEYIYKVDRMLFQLKRTGVFDELGGLIVGGFDSMKDTTAPFGKNVFEVISDVVKEYEFPVCFHFPVGHEKENLALKIGGQYAFTVNDRSVRLKEL